MVGAHLVSQSAGERLCLSSSYLSVVKIMK